MFSQVAHKKLSPNIFSLRLWTDETEPSVLKEMFDNLLILTEYKVLNFSEHYFPTRGYTAIWLLAESHLAVHTFPEHKWTYVELSGCNQQKTSSFKIKLESCNIGIRLETDLPTQSFPEKYTTHLKGK